MATAAVTYTFTAGTAAVASQVNQNYTDLVTFLNNQVVHKDGSVAMTGNLTLPGNPTSALQAIPKQYQDPLVVAKLTGSYDIGTISTNFYIPTSFTMPTVTNNHGVRFEFYVPRWFQYLALGGTDVTITFEKTDGTDLQVHQFYSINNGGYENGPLLFRYDTYDNSVFTAGSTVNVRYNGITNLSGVRLQGTSSAPIFYTVTRI